MFIEYRRLELLSHKKLLKGLESVFVKHIWGNVGVSENCIAIFKFQGASKEPTFLHLSVSQISE